jgi:hypothetical protein
VLFFSFQAVTRGIRSSSKTVFVLSPEFLADVWACISDVKPLADPNGVLIQRDAAVIVVGRCDVPRVLFDAAYMDAFSPQADQSWWPALIRFVTQTGNVLYRSLVALIHCICMYRLAVCTVEL